MTSLTGKTEATLSGTREPPTFVSALGGGLVGVGGLVYVWVKHTSAGDCVLSPMECLQSLGSADPWGRQVLVTLLFAFGLWVASLVMGENGTSDPSLVDRLWSIQPWLYVWHFYLSSPVPNPRLLIMALVSSVWGLRLTYNFYIKGGFSGGEDYRWAEIRKWFPGWQFEAFNFVFICFFQQLIILGFSAPAVLALQFPSGELNQLDYVAAGLYLLLVAGEALADKQMFNYQTEKYRRRGLKQKEFGRGFCETGLWRYSRHPNYFCEVSLWWAFYLFAVSASGQWLNWTILGAVGLTGLFVPPGGSLDTTEALSSRKYPAYAEYQKTTARFVPWFPSSSKKSK